MKRQLSQFRPMGLMRAVLAATLVCALGSSTFAGPVLFDPDGGGAGGAVLIDTFDELPGNALAIGAQTAINNALVGLPAGQTRTTAVFTVLYQANISLLTNPNGIPLNTGNAFTAVAKFQEFATVTGGSNTVTFTLAPTQTGSYFNIYSHAPGQFGNNATGVGFATDGPSPGTLIYSATPPTSGPSGNFTNNDGSTNLDQSLNPGTGQQSVSGSGSTQLTFNTVSFDANFFKSNPGSLAAFQSTNSLPFISVKPSATFVNLTGPQPNPVIPALGTVNGSTTNGGPDVQFQADGSTAFNAVPEPASVAMTLMGLGGTGLGMLATRRRKVAKA